MEAAGTSWMPSAVVAGVVLPTDPIEFFPDLSTGTVIGITVAIAGNVLISLALNIQKLAHKRIDAENSAASPPPSVRPANGQPLASPDETEEESLTPTPALLPVLSTPSESTSLLLSQNTASPHYAATSSTSQTVAHNQKSPRSRFFARLHLPNPFARNPHTQYTIPKQDITVLPAELIVPPLSNGGKNPSSNETIDSETVGNESDYLSSKLWCTLISRIFMHFILTSVLPGGSAFSS
jgi:magnesium transporter